MTPYIVDCEGVVHIYKTADLEVVALQGLDLQVAPGEMVAIAGRSGSGKTTLMNILAGLERPSAGAVHVAGHDLTRLERAEEEAYRREVVGYVLQRALGNLAPYLSALENVQAATVTGPPKSARLRGGRSPAILGLGDHLSSGRPSSPGTRRNAWRLPPPWPTARAFCSPTNPPPSSTPPATVALLGDLTEVLRESGTAAVIVTHDTLSRNTSTAW